MNFFNKLFGSNEREIKKIQKIVEEVNAFEEAIKKLSDDEIRAKSEEFREILKGGKTEDDILPEAFAVVREASFRVLEQRHFDVQILGGVVLHRGKIAEMKTGEGKTLTSTLAIYLNAVSKKGVHVVTVNDYLARRDCNWMGAIFEFLGLSTACIMHSASFLYESKKRDDNEVSIESENLKPVTRKEAYEADITYGTNNEFGFDYLRDNMAQRAEDRVQRPFHYAIVDEVDSILIDEARTPLIISAPDTESTGMYAQFANIAKRLVRDTDYTVEERSKTVAITDEGISKVEKTLGVSNLYDPSNIRMVHQLEQSLKANAIFERDKDYVVKDNEVIIVDDFTGRLMPGRRYSEGLHQALEAKEGVVVQRESRTLATITFQNFFRMYTKLAGMTGTASTSAEEFSKVYSLDVVEIPTNKILIRKDLPDVIYKTQKSKFQAIARKVEEVHKKGQPILIGTIAIEKSEYLSQELKKKGVVHEILNAKHHEKEAEIIARAGKKGAVTIATNMAGRGTDIKLGEGVAEVGGLFILGSERHEARRIDNQLRGRAGRQGDPGVSQFYVSLDDELMRRFGGEKLKNLMNTLGLPDDEAIKNSMISKSIENAQKKIEGFNFDIRKHVWEYDDIMNKQREVVYKKRYDILISEDVKPLLLDTISTHIETVFSRICVGEEPEWDMKQSREEFDDLFALNDKDERELVRIRDDRSMDIQTKKTKLQEYMFGKAKEEYAKKEKELGEEVVSRVGKSIYLRTIDMLWMNHLDEMEYMRQGIGLRGYGQRDPLIEYKKEAFYLFSGLMDSVRMTVLSSLFRLEQAPASMSMGNSLLANAQMSGPTGQMKQFGAYDTTQGSEAEKKQQPAKVEKKIGRNDPCVCGSGKKYKKCCGKNL
jgi:preprotein translocase subunit SecA